MNIAQGRTEAYHVELRIALREETTLQTGMNTLYQWLFAEELFVSLHSQVGKLAVGAHLPSRILVAYSYLGASQKEGCLYGVGHVRQIAHHVTSLRSYDVDAAFIGHHACHIA